VDERELVQKTLQGDPEAQNLLVRQYRDPLRRVCVHILGYQDPEVEDVLQETFLRAFQKMDRFEFRSSLGRWLNQICVHQCYNRWRRRKRMVVQAVEDLEVLLAPASVRVEDEGRRNRVQEKRLAVLAEQKKLLGYPCREILALRDESGESYAHIAETLGIAMGTVMSRLARCRKALKDLVQKALAGETDG